MGNYFWSGCTVVLSIVGFAVGVADKRPGQEQTAQNVDVPEKAVAVMHPTEKYQATGTILLTQEKDGVRLKGKIQGLSPGQHGFHIHEFGDLRADDGQSAGGHFAPRGHKHGGPDDPEHHAGDLGNITADSNGIAKVDKLAKDLKLHFVVGRSLVVHAEADDLESQPSGDAGDRAALGVIGFASDTESSSRITKTGE